MNFSNGQISILTTYFLETDDFYQLFNHMFHKLLLKSDKNFVEQPLNLKSLKL